MSKNQVQIDRGIGIVDHGLLSPCIDRHMKTLNGNQARLNAFDPMKKKSKQIRKEVVFHFAFSKSKTVQLEFRHCMYIRTVTS